MSNTDKKYPVLRKILISVAYFVAIFILIIIITWLLWNHPWERKLYATCDNNYAIWEKNPGMGFWPYSVYHIKQGTKYIETGLSYNELHDFMHDNGCVGLGGG